MIRYAIVKNARSRSEAEAYLPDNYKVIWEGQYTDPNLEHYGPQQVFVIQGEDVAGWTFEKYVQPRYASGLIFAEEIDLSHPVMKRVPVDGLKRPRPFLLMVDAASDEEPPNRYFGSLEAAVAAMEQYDEHWRRFAWIIEFPVVGGVVAHYKGGKKVTADAS